MSSDNKKFDDPYSWYDTWESHKMQLENALKYIALPLGGLYLLNIVSGKTAGYILTVEVFLILSGLGKYFAPN